MNFLQIVFYFTRIWFTSNAQKSLELLALRSQLAVFQQKEAANKIIKPRVNKSFRILWFFLSKFFHGWKNVLVIVKPETVVKWHKSAFKFYWKRKSKRGRPKISLSTIALIKRIHKENPTLSPEKIHEQLLNLNIIDTPAPNTIAKYIKSSNKPSPTEAQKQSWKTFLKNHVGSI